MLLSRYLIALVFTFITTMMIGRCLAADDAAIGVGARRRVKGSSGAEVDAASVKTGRPETASEAEPDSSRLRYRLHLDPKIGSRVRK